MIRSIVFSGPPAVGKTTVSKALAEKFSLKYISGGDILKELTVEEGFEPGGDDWWDTENGMRFLEMRNNDNKYDKKVDEKLQNLYTAGGVVITSYTLPWLVQGGVKVWLDGSLENRAMRMRARDGIDDSAIGIAQERYDKNRALYMKLYGFDFGKDLSKFDVIINTDGLEADGVVKQALEAVGSFL